MRRSKGEARRRNAAQAADAADGDAGASGVEWPKRRCREDGVDARTAAAQEEKLYSDLDAVKMINLPPDERMQRIVAMSPEEFMAFRKSLSQAELAAA